MFRRVLALTPWVVIAQTAWFLMAAGTGIYWMIRDSKYVNDVMIPSVVLALLLGASLVLVARRIRRRRVP